MVGQIGYTGHTVGGAGSPIISIQTGTLDITSTNSTDTDTITSVDTSLSAIFYNGHTTTNSAATDNVDGTAVVEITNTTTVTGTRGDNATDNAVSIKYTVVEFAASAINNIQEGTITVGAGDATETATITSVDTSKSVLLFNGCRVVNGTSSEPNRLRGHAVLTNATTVTATFVGTSNNKEVGYTIIEFK